ncbi:MAG: hypothetical protein SCALA702_33830 [Melioribacteraceae bacterium]|nr:MAG: hypothetical protein SCALA702_33830 [Melioribacteraceae bacterium]
MNSNTLSKYLHDEESPFDFNREISRSSYFWTFWLIAISNINMFLGNVILFVTFVIAAITFITKNKKIQSQFETFVILIILVLIGQSLWYMNFAIGSMMSLITRIFTAFFIISIIGKDFFKAFIDVIYFLAVISIIMWVLIVLFPPFYRFLILNVAPLFDFYLYEIKYARPAPHMILFTFNHGVFINDSGIARLFIRNSGPFTEPSVFAPYLVIAFTLNYLREKKAFNKRNLVFMFAMFTSYSTGGFVVLGMLGGAAVLLERGAKKILLLPISVLIFLYAFFNIEAFGEEIGQKVTDLNSSDIRYAKRTRLVNAILDINDLFNHPFFGKGFYKDETELANRSLGDYLTRRTNGTTKFLNRYGFIGFFIFFYSIYKSYRIWGIWTNAPPVFALVGVFGLMLVGFGNSIFEKPFFFGLGFAGIILTEHLRVAIREHKE